MSFHLNKESTNDQLEDLITGMKIELIRGNGQGDDAVIDATFQFDETTLAADDVTKVLDMFKNTAVSYFADDLQSMTEYHINATVYAKYQDEEYEITPQLTNYTFKFLIISIFHIFTSKPQMPPCPQRPLPFTILKFITINIYFVVNSRNATTISRGWRQFNSINGYLAVTNIYTILNCNYHTSTSSLSC